MTRTILRFWADAIETSDPSRDGFVVVHTHEGVHRFDALADDLGTIATRSSARVEVVVLARLSDRGGILGGTLLDVFFAGDPVEKSGVVKRRSLDEDDVDVAFDRMVRR